MITVGAVKQRVADVLMSRPLAAAIGPVTGHRIRNHGLTIDTAALDLDSKTEAALFWHVYESAEIRRCRKYLAGKSLVIELGSGVGIASAHIASVMNSQGHLVCVEADPALARKIRLNAEAHTRGAAVEVVTGAVTCPNDNEPARLRRSSNIVSSRLGESPADSEIVETVPIQLAELVERLRGSSSDAYALVCDIEGAEVELVSHDASALERCELIIIEAHSTLFHGQRLHWTEVLEKVRGTTNMRIIDQRSRVAVLAR